MGPVGMAAGDDGSTGVDGLRGDSAGAKGTSRCGACASMCLSGDYAHFCEGAQNTVVGERRFPTPRSNRVPTANYELEDIEARSLLSLMEQHSRSCSPIPQE